MKHPPQVYMKKTKHMGFLSIFSTMEFFRGFAKATLLCFSGVLLFGVMVTPMDLAAEGLDLVTDGGNPFEAMANSLSQAFNEEWIIDKEGAEKSCGVKKYTIKRPQDLIDNIEDLECIFWAGRA